MTTAATPSLPAVTIVVEWENAIDVEDKWTQRAMLAFQEELRRCAPRFKQRPRVMYLYDKNSVSEQSIQKVITQAAPDLSHLAELELVPTAGLTYYKLKNHGAQLAKTEITILLDCDAGPRPGWLTGMVEPFAASQVQAVAGFCVLGHEDLVSRTMALSWIMELPSEREFPVKHRKMFPNNCAFRTEFFKQNPFPDLVAFKKACGFWQREVESRGIKIAFAPDAMIVHAPQTPKFLVWRAWATGLDRDFKTFHTVTRSKLGRVGYSFFAWATKIARSWTRIVTKGGEVDLPIWQYPAAMFIACGFFTIMLLGELWAAATRRYEPAVGTVADSVQQS
jgi:hypothetical protein